MKLMKKMGALAIVLTVILSTGMCVFAANTSAASDEAVPVYPSRYRNGKHLLKHSGRDYCIFADNDGDGFCDTCRRHMGHHEGMGCHGRHIMGCTAHTDADIDNICDICGIVLTVQEEFSPSDNLEMAGEYGLCAYVDADGDGICDNCHQQSGHHANGNGDGPVGCCRIHTDSNGDNNCDVCGVSLLFDSGSSQPPASGDTQADSGVVNGGYGTCVYTDFDGDGFCDYCYQHSDHHANGNCGNMGGSYCSTHGDADGDGYCDICGVECYSVDVPANSQTVDSTGEYTDGSYGGYGCNPSGGGSRHHGSGHHGRGHH